MVINEGKDIVRFFKFQVKSVGNNSFTDLHYNKILVETFEVIKANIVADNIREHLWYEFFLLLFFVCFLDWQVLSRRTYLECHVEYCLEAFYLMLLFPAYHFVEYPLT